MLSLDTIIMVKDWAAEHGNPGRRRGERGRMSAGVDLLPAPRLAGDIELRLAQLADRQMVAPARTIGVNLPVAGVTALPPQRPVVARAQSGALWSFADHRLDPTAQGRNAKIPVPEKQHAQLTALHAAGVRPDVVWLAHQLPEGWQSGDAVPVPAPARLRERDWRLARRLGRGTRLLRGGARVAAAGLGVAAALGSALGTGLDPVVLGGVVDEEAQAAMWVILAQWDWE